MAFLQHMQAPAVVLNTDPGCTAADAKDNRVSGSRRATPRLLLLLTCVCVFSSSGGSDIDLANQGGLHGDREEQIMKQVGVTAAIVAKCLRFGNDPHPQLKRGLYRINFFFFYLCRSKLL